MTPAEHRLIIEMFKLQTQTFADLVEVLKGQGIVQQGDLEAHHALIAQSERLAALERQVENTYQEFATALGVQTGQLDGEKERA